MRRAVTCIALFVSLLAFGPTGPSRVAAQDRHRPQGGGAEPGAPATGRAEPRKPPTGGTAEPRPPDRRPPEKHPPVRPGSVVFVGGYFYDPFFGPYPWWPRGWYTYGYYPTLQNRAVVRVTATPVDAAVYVDGFYAGVVDDFDGFFEGLPLPAGGHEITIYHEGYRTVQRRIYVAPATTFKLREDLERLPPGMASEPPALAPPVPAPPEGSYLPPRTGGPLPLPPGSVPQSEEACPMGVLAIRVQPASAEVWIDGERWVSSASGSFEIELPAGSHRLQVRGTGYREYAGSLDVRDGETTRLDITLMRDHP
jgi:hypothetical protein